MKTVTALALLMGAVALGCSADVADETVVVGGEQPLSCTDPQTKSYELEATLASVVARELGRWEPHLDFRIDQSNWSVALTEAGLAQCEAKGVPGCPVTAELLSLQFNGQPEIKDHDEGHFRNLLTAHLGRYMSFYQNRMIPQVDGVTLDPSHETEWSCGTMKWFISSDPDASKLFYKMIAYGGATSRFSQADNPFLNFSVRGDQVGIDPNNDLDGNGGNSESGMCSTAPTKVDSTHACAGTCCFADGRYGSYVKLGGTRFTYTCQPNP